MKFIAASLLLFALVSGVLGHGRMMEPPSRASMWRFGYDTPPDYDDNQCFCGGFNHEWNELNGKCGICGDDWDDPQPRAHEAGGKYGNGIIVRQYSIGQNIKADIEITANHLGHFEFKICPNNDPTKVATQECLNKYPLIVAEIESTKYYIGSDPGYYNVTLRLPVGLDCSQCVLQWRYIAGNNWGMCDNGTSAVGCGPQEEFRACADVAIGQSVVTSTKPTPAPSQRPTELTEIPTKRPFTKKTIRPSSKKPVYQTTHTSSLPVTDPTKPLECEALGIWATVTGMDEWCNVNCNTVVVFCPPTHCKCTTNAHYRHL